MAATILYGARETMLPGAAAAGERLWVPLADLETATGWHLAPEGLCVGSTCVPIPAGNSEEWIDREGDRFDLAAFGRHLGQPAARDDAHAVWSFGETARSRSAAGGDLAIAPDFTLPDLDGRQHSLSEHRGKKVFLFCWASW